MSRRKRSVSRPVRSRRPTLAWAVVPVAVAGAAWLVSSTARRERSPAIEDRARRSNVLVVSVDTLRADALGVYGGTVASTPALDALAAAGVVFEHAVSHVPLTLPSHASIFTSLVPPAHGVRDNATFRLDASMTTLAEAFRSAGYRTAAFVGAFVLDARFGLDQGFDVYDDVPAGSGEPERRADEVLETAAAWLTSQDAAEPWFVFVHLFDPHAPYEAPDPFGSLHRASPYHGEVAFVDDALGTFLASLRNRALLEETVVVVTADHGEGLGEHGERSHGMFAYESTLRVPLLLHWPGGLPAGRRVASRVRHIDLAPTLLDLTGIPVPAEFAGESLAGLIAGREEALDRTSYFEALTFSFNRGTAPLFGLYHGPHKLISLPLPELYDLSSDPHELDNLVATRAALARRMTEELRTILVARKVESSRIPTSEIDAASLERMHSLGYIVAPSRLQDIEGEYGPEDDPKRWVHLANRLDEAVTHHRAGRLDEAEGLLRSILEERPSVATAVARLARVLNERGDGDEAIALLEDAFARGVRSPSTIHLLGRLLQEDGRAGRWIDVLRSVVEAYPDDGDALAALAMALAREGRGEEAISPLRKLAALRPGDAGTQLDLGLALLDTGRFEDSRERLERAVERDPSLAMGWAALGDVHAELGRLSDAVAAWSRAVDLDPALHATLVRLGLALAQAGRREEAVRHLERFAASAPPELYAEEIAQVRELVEAIRDGGAR